MRSSLRKPMPVMSIATSAALAIAAMIFGASRDFSMFLFGVPVIGVLLVLAVAMLGLEAVGRKSRGGGITLSALLLLLAPVAAYGARHLHDRVAFLAWSLRHHAALQDAGSTDRVITHWESWGMAGLENDSYLIFDQRDDSGTVPAAERWRHRMGLACPIVATTRMRKNIYIVTTFECALSAMPA